jgi:hypothetical protein
MSETLKLAAILVTDIGGYCPLAGIDEDRTLARLRTLRSDLIDPAIATHHGRIVKRRGDGSTIEFRSVVDAVHCEIAVQIGLDRAQLRPPPERRIALSRRATAISRQRSQYRHGWGAWPNPARSVFPRTPVGRKQRNDLRVSDIAWLSDDRQDKCGTNCGASQPSVD